MPPRRFQSSRESILGVDFLKFPKRGVSGAWRSLAILGDLTSRDFSEAFSTVFLSSSGAGKPRKRATAEMNLRVLRLVPRRRVALNLGVGAAARCFGLTRIHRYRQERFHG